MNEIVEHQITALKNIYSIQKQKIYTDNFCMKLAYAMSKHNKSYIDLLKKIDITASIIERAIAKCDARRCFHYLIIYINDTDRLFSLVDADCIAPPFSY